MRGAFNAVLKRLEETGDRATPLVTASAGNHGRAMAYAAKQAGLPLTVYAPDHAPRTKLDAIGELGAELRPCRDYDEAELRAKEHGASGRALFISPYSHPDVIAGAGTIGLELLEDQPDLDLVIVPIGGGGLISGIATAVRGLSTRTAVIGVEVEASSPFTHGLAAGHIVTIDVGRTLADGLSGNLDPDTITFDIVRSLVASIMLVDETRLAEAVSGLVRVERLIAEGAGAAATAAILNGGLPAGSRKIAAIVSGANIDPEKLKALI